MLIDDMVQGERGVEDTSVASTVGDPSSLFDDNNVDEDNESEQGIEDENKD
jgi:hypothetical protein